MEKRFIKHVHLIVIYSIIFTIHLEFMPTIVGTLLFFSKRDGNQDGKVNQSRGVHSQAE